MQVLLPLLPYLFLVANLAATMGLFFGVSRRVAGLRKGIRNCDASLQAEAAQLTNAINELNRKIAELEKIESRVSADAEPGAGLSNLARGKVLKLHRSGQAPDHIAQVLRLPKGEVDLLVKVQRLVMRPYETAETPAGRVQKD